MGISLSSCSPSCHSLHDSVPHIQKKQDDASEIILLLRQLIDQKQKIDITNREYVSCTYPNLSSTHNDSNKDNNLTNNNIPQQIPLIVNNNDTSKSNTVLYDETKNNTQIINK